MKFNWNISLLAIPLFTVSCARQTTPTGGPKDTIPPILINGLSIPKKGATTYKSQEVRLVFDEYITLNNPKEQIIITPDVDKKYDVVAKKKTVVLSFDTKLKDSTTYTINYRNSIQDITEKNPARNVKIAFSTGSYIDSLSIEGTIIDPLEFKKIKQATVAIYASDTFNIFKHKPTIVTETDDNGEYILENLKPGKYFLYAFLDKNKNLVVDSKNEYYGFQGNPISLTNNIAHQDVRLQKLDNRALKLTSARPYNTYFNIKLTKNLKSHKITSASTTVPSTFGDTQENIKVFLPVAPGDSVLVRLTATDSVDNRIDTTLYAKLLPKPGKREQFTWKSESFKMYHNTGLLTGGLTFNKPIKHITIDSIFYRIDSLHTITFNNGDFQLDSMYNRITIKKKIDKTLFPVPTAPNALPAPGAQTPARKTSEPKEKESPETPQYQLHFGKGFLISIEQDSSVVSNETVKPIYLADTGILFINVQTTAQDFTIELLDNAFKIVASASNQKKFSFQDLIPGDYQIRFVEDTDKNHQWTPGNFNERKEAEKTTLYQNEKGISTIKLKANFEWNVLIKY